jgi:acyl carrier protein
MHNPESIVHQLAEILSNFQGREYSDPIEGHTLFFGDLGFSSIDAVILGEELESQFGQSIPFHKFLAELNERQVRDIAIGDLANFLSNHLN